MTNKTEQGMGKQGQGTHKQRTLGLITRRVALQSFPPLFSVLVEVS